jgi:hypothetical protein
VNTGANGFDRMAESQVACSGRRLAWLKIRQLIFNWQLTVAHGRLNWLPVLFGFVCGLNKGVT